VAVMKAHIKTRKLEDERYDDFEDFASFRNLEI
jgi:hypothetical protein